MEYNKCIHLPPNGTGYNPAPYPSSHQLTDVSQPQGYPNPGQSYLPTANQGVNPPIQYPNSANNIASAPSFGLNNQDHISPPNYNEATATQNKI